MIVICKRFLLLSTSILILCFALSTSAQQSATATLIGRVMDPNQAMVTGAQVTATQMATGTTRSSTTNSEGVFVITNLPADEFEVKIQSPGFSVRTLKVALQVGQSETLNVTLSVSPVSFDSDIYSERLINTQASVVDGVVSKREI